MSDSVLMDRSTPGLPVHHLLPELAHSCPLSRSPRPLQSPSPPALDLSHHRVFSNEPALRIRWPKYWSFSLSISPCNEHPGLIYLRMDWLDLLAVQGTLKSLLQHHSSKASILWHSTFKNFLPQRKEWTLRLITFSSQPIPVSGRSQEFLAPVVES